MTETTEHSPATGRADSHSEAVRSLVEMLERSRTEPVGEEEMDALMNRVSAGPFDPAEVMVDFRGHFGCEDTGPIPSAGLTGWQRTMLADIAGNLGRVNLMQALSNYTKNSNPGAPQDHTCQLRNECSECGQSLEARYRDGVVSILAPCPHPGGVKPFTVSLNVPSGRIAFANDFRDLVRLRTLNDDHYVNVVSEIKRCTEDYADAGMIHFFTGNSCPGIYGLADGELAVISRGWRDVVNDPEEAKDGSARADALETGEDHADHPVRLPADAQSLGSVITDLWWVSAMDYDGFREACRKKEADEQDFAPVVVDVEPGLWEFTVYPRARKDDGYDETYATARRSGPCRVVIKPELPPARHLWETEFWRRWALARRKYPTLYPAIGEYLEHRLCVLGSGASWEDGQLRSSEGDARFDRLGGPKVKPFAQDPRMQAVPALPRLFVPGSTGVVPDGKKRPRRVYPMCDRYVTAGKAPLGIDPWWLAASLIVFRTLQELPDLLSDDDEDQVVIVNQVLDLLGTIAAERGLWDDLHANHIPTLLNALLTEIEPDAGRAAGWALGQYVRISGRTNGWLLGRVDGLSGDAWAVKLDDGRDDSVAVAFSVEIELLD